MSRTRTDVQADARAYAQSRFLGMLRVTGSVSQAARAASVSRRTAYGWRRREATFRALWAEALDHAVDTLEETAWSRAVEGIEKPIYFRGECIGTERTYSDRMLELLLKAHRPERFRDRAGGEPGSDLADLIRELNVQAKKN